MSSVRKTTIKILSEQPNQQMDFVLLARSLMKEDVLGFGVETEDVISALVGENKVTYDSETDVVSLINGT